MNTNFKLMTVAMVMVGMVVRISGAQAQMSGPALTDAEQFMRNSGAHNVPEAAMYWPNTSAQESVAAQLAQLSGSLVPEAALFLDPSQTVVGELTPPVVQVINHTQPETDAEQYLRSSGAHSAPEAAMYWPNFSTQESVAAQLARLSGALVPEAALFLDPSQTVVGELTPPIVQVINHTQPETDAEQYLRSSGAHSAPEAAMYWPNFSTQESIASRTAGVTTP